MTKHRQNNIFKQFSFQDVFFFFYQTLYRDDSQLCYDSMILYTIFLYAKCV